MVPHGRYSSHVFAFTPGGLEMLLWIATVPHGL